MRQLEAPLAAVLPNAQEHEDNDDFADNVDNDWGKNERDDEDDRRLLLEEPGEDERNWDSSSTEPESEDEEEHTEWEARQKARWERYQMVKRNENSRRRKNGEGSLRDSEDEHGNEELEDLEVRRREARREEELRLQEEFRRLQEACRLEEAREMEEARRLEEVRLQEEARRKEVREKEKRLQQEIERRVEEHRRGLEESTKDLDVDPRPAKARRKDVMPVDRKEEGPSRKLTISIPPKTRATTKRVLFIHNMLFFPPLI